MALSDRPAERHRQVAGLFTERACGTRSWDAPSPVPEWTARDVVRHLTDWFPGFLAAGAGIAGNDLYSRATKPPAPTQVVNFVPPTGLVKNQGLRFSSTTTKS